MNQHIKMNGKAPHTITMCLFLYKCQVIITYQLGKSVQAEHLKCFKFWNENYSSILISDFLNKAVIFYQNLKKIEL